MDLALNSLSGLARGELLAETAKRWGILVLGDSQCAGKAQVVTALTPTNEPGFAFSATQATTFTKYYRQVSEVANDPPVFNITNTNVAVQPYTGVGSVVFGGPEIGIGQILTKWGIPAVVISYAVVGLACKQMVPTPSPMYPTGGPSWHTTMVAFVRNIEVTQNVRIKLVLVSSSNNDGFNATDSGNLPANIGLQYAGITAAFPGAPVCWIKIPADTINVASYRADTFTNQATGFSNNPTIRQIWVDDQLPLIGIQSDHAHLTPNGEFVFGTRGFWAGYDLMGYARPRTSGAPILVGDGPMTATDGTGAPTSDGSPMAGDGEILVTLDMVNATTFGTKTTPSGWTLVSSQTFNSGTGVGARLALYTRAVDSTMLNANHGNTAATSVALDSPSTRLFNKILTFRGSNPASPPTLVQVVYGGTVGSTSSYTGPSLTTGGTNRRVVAVTVGYIASSLQTTVTLTGFTGGAVERNSMCITPGTAGGVIDVQSTIVATASTINITNVATNHAITGPVTALIELSS